VTGPRLPRTAAAAFALSPRASDRNARPMAGALSLLSRAIKPNAKASSGELSVPPRSSARAVLIFPSYKASQPAASLESLSAPPVDSAARARDMSPVRTQPQAMVRVSEFRAPGVSQRSKRATRRSASDGRPIIASARACTGM
jgi:hypothetical protein